MYYTIKTKTDNETGNVFPQAGCLNQNLAHSINLDKFSNLDSELLFNLEPKAKLTDVLSQAAISAYGFLINNKVKHVMQNFRLINHNYNKAFVKDHKGIYHQYSWLHLDGKFENLDWLDFENSTFYVKEYGFRENDITIRSYQDYKQKSIEIGDMAVIIIEKIGVKKGAEIDFDMFTIPLLTRQIFISERLKTTLEDNKILGISTEEVFE